MFTYIWRYVSWRVDQIAVQKSSSKADRAQLKRWAFFFYCTQQCFQTTNIRRVKSLSEGYNTGRASTFNAAWSLKSACFCSSGDRIMISSAACRDWFYDAFQKSKIAYKNNFFCLLLMWVSVTLAMLHVWHLCTPWSSPLRLILHPRLSPICDSLPCLALIQPWLSYLSWFTRCLCKIWECIQTYQGRYFKSTPPTVWKVRT